MNRVLMGVAVVFAATIFGCATAPQGNGTFRIMSYNIRHGESMERVTDARATGRVMAAEAPRFVGVQEVDMGTRRVNGADTCRILEQVTGLHATFAKAIDFDGGEYGNAVLSREVPLDVKRIPLPGAEPRVLLLCEFDDCWFGTMHLAVDSEEARMKSIEIIRKAVADCGSKPVFLSGDWNARPSSPVIDGLKGFLSILSSETEPTFHPRECCIDYIAVDADHRGEYALRGHCVVQNRTASDHMPVVVDVEASAKRRIK